ncbi:hypothetical protein BC629DRAFT_146146 [Irpex lacteus]|nr:hypothetical protein BC629DRAFT_146146 [Irpex lacteus]
MSVSAITSRGTRKRFVFVRRRPSLCGDRLDVPSHHIYSSETSMTLSSTSSGGYGVGTGDYEGPSMKTKPWSPMINSTPFIDEPKEFTTVINHTCPVVSESRAGSEFSDSSSDTSSDTIVALEPPTKSEALAGDSTSRTFTSLPSAIQASDLTSTTSTRAYHRFSPVPVVLWRVALVILTALGYLTRVYHAIPAYHLLNDLISSPPFPLTFTIAAPTMLSISGALRSSVCASRVPVPGKTELCSRPTVLNYASFDLGARPIEEVSPTPHSPDPTHESIYDNISSSLDHLSGQGQKIVPIFPAVVLQNTPSTLVQGMCWPMTGATGNHFLSGAWAENESAPRNIVLSGATASAELGDEVISAIASTRLDARSPLRDEVVHLLRPGEDLLPIGKMFYDIGGPTTQWIAPQQSFPWNKVKVSTVVLEVEGNWGHKRTCLYNLEVFGHT